MYLFIFTILYITALWGLALAVKKYFNELYQIYYAVFSVLIFGGLFIGIVFIDQGFQNLVYFGTTNVKGDCGMIILGPLLAHWLLLTPCVVISQLVLNKRVLKINIFNLDL